MLIGIEPSRRFRDGPQAKHVPRGQRGLGRGSITVSLITLTYKPKWSESDTGTEVPISVGAGEAPEDDPLMIS
jgi:hypothetical protein